MGEPDISVTNERHSIPPTAEQRSPALPILISYLTLRRIIGWIAVLLPVILVAARLFLHGHIYFQPQWPDSASGFYYSGMRDFFVGSMCALGVFLLAYRGYGRADFWITFIAGACAIGVGLFPTKPSCAQLQPNCPTPSQNLVGDFHNLFAFTLLVLMAVMSLRFAKSGDEHAGKRKLAWLGFANNLDDRDGRTARKKRWSHWYRGLALLTAFCGIIFLICGFTKWLLWFQQHIRIFLLVVESTAVFSFGVAWFLKGRSLLFLHRAKVLRDTPNTNADAVQHGRAVAERIIAGDSAREVAQKLNITRQRVTEIAAEIT